MFKKRDRTGLSSTLILGCCGCSQVLETNPIAKLLCFIIHWEIVHGDKIELIAWKKWIFSYFLSLPSLWSYGNLHEGIDILMFWILDVSDSNEWVVKCECAYFILFCPSNERISSPWLSYHSHIYRMSFNWEDLCWGNILRRKKEIFCPETFFQLGSVPEIHGV